MHADFVSVVLADTEDVWKQLLPQLGQQYQEPRLVLFRDVVQSACGMQQAADMRKAQDDYIRQTAGAAGSSSVDDIAKAKSLLDSGAITQAEFDAIKSKALAG